MNMGTLCKIVKTAVFTLILIILFHVFTNILINKGSFDKGNQYQLRMKEFYDEVPGTLDAVYIGASHVYTYWQAPIAWNKDGIAVFPFSSGSQPVTAIPFLIEEVKKTQPQALIIANINQIVATDTKANSVHWLADTIPFSKNKLNMIKSLYEDGDGDDAPDILEYFVPMIRFHSRWNELTEQDIHFNRTDGLKGACYFSDFFKKEVDVSQNYEKVDLNKRVSLSQYGCAALENILNYCDAEKVNILFVIVPQFTGDERRTAQYNSAQDYIESRGYIVLNFTQRTDELGLNITQDYLDLVGKHLNIHGALKFTNYLADYLVDHYGFENKRGGNSMYASWDKAGHLYSEMIEPYLTKGELEYGTGDS